MIKQNLSAIKTRIASVCARAGRNPQEITLVAVSKGRTVRQIEEVTAEGIIDIGENRVQEALRKYYELREIKWHMVGHLQTNKAKEAVRIFDLIQCLDSRDIALEIDRQAHSLGKVQNVLIQVNTACELTKFGLKPDEVIEVIGRIAEFKNINIKGLMTIAPVVDDAQETRPYFRILRELKDKINESGVMGYELGVLSMGMSDDFEIAIEEGSNMLRLGRAIFAG